MKKILYIVAVAAAVAACTVQKTPEGTGMLSLTAAQEGVYATKANDVLADFVVDIVRPSDGWTKHYDRYIDIPQTISLGSGDYTITVASPQFRNAAWDLPYYKGTADFTIRVDELTPVNVTASLQNMKVSFVLTDNFKNELTSYTIVVTNASSWDASDAASKTLTWSSATGDVEQTAGYFSVAPLRVKVDGYRAIDNSETHSELVIPNVAAQDYHIITLDARVTGQMNGISITIDPSLNDRESSVEVPGWDEVPVDGGNDPDPEPDPGPGPDPQPATAPTMTWASNPEFARTPIRSEMDVNITINAQEGIRDFVIDVDSSILGGVIAGMGGESNSDGTVKMDLINNASLVTALGNLGVPTGDQLKDKTEVEFSLSNLVPMILMYSPASGSEHTFTLKVTDNKSQSLEKAIVFYVE
ncbi:MAG: DUF4493 domain-containing protein [Bacteroidales bacterium]|nr:DUF4493 domain-containing protein [Bacteroidales bacterium]